MSYKVLLVAQARQDSEKLSLTIKRQLYKKLVHFASLDDIKTAAKKLNNYDAGEYRLRVGNFRIIFDLDRRTLVVLRIQHRKDIYR
jgi:mRNA-degrading endonuclease RelE of RelBE toxin-antitoxin system